MKSVTDHLGFETYTLSPTGVFVPLNIDAFVSHVEKKGDLYAERRNDDEDGYVIASVVWDNGIYWLNWWEGGEEIPADTSPEEILGYWISFLVYVNAQYG